MLQRLLLGTTFVLSVALQVGAQTFYRHWTPLPGIYNPSAGLGNGFRVSFVSVGVANSNVVWGIGGELPPTTAPPSSYVFNKWVRSTDGGTTWTTGNLQISTGYTVGQLVAIDAQTAFMLTYNGIGGGGEVRRTTDGGATWVNLNGPNQMNFTLAGSWPDAMTFFDANNGVVFGDPQPSVTGAFQVYTTADGGSTWTRVPAANLPAPIGADEYANIGSIAKIGSTVWVGGTNQGGGNARVFKSTNMGRTWTVGNTPFPDVLKIAFSTPTHGLIASAPDLASTTNGGTSFTTVAYSGPFYAQYDLASVPGRPGLYVATGYRDPLTTANDYGSVITSSSGFFWRQIDSTAVRYDLDIVSDNLGYAAGNNPNSAVGSPPGVHRAMWKNTQTFWFICDFLPSRVGSAAARREVYPNPSSNGQFTVDLPRGSQALNVFDALGRQVLARQLAGSAAGMIQVDLSRQPAGIYTLQISSETGVSHQKIQIE
ncbi:T9SS type A sorting domain-containing protein [Hymenobacter busanensis]|nr:T9SS type A sorting domain-containing protein [Hymenobacter busanensis]QHJ06696.1 T9SS type A sorting domain-containing protein [Hymenobacter busanensis]